MQERKIRRRRMSRFAVPQLGHPYTFIQEEHLKKKDKLRERRLSVTKRKPRGRGEDGMSDYAPGEF